MMNNGKKARFVIAMLAVTMALGACSSAGSSTATSAADTTTAVSTTAADGETTAAGGETTAADGETTAADGETTAAEETLAAEAPADPDFSQDLDENGNLTNSELVKLVTLPDYKNMTLNASDLEVTEDAVQSEIDSMMETYAKKYPVEEGEVKDGDTVNIDYVGKIDGEEFDGGNTNGAGTDVTIGETQYIDDFLQQLIGHQVGETIEIEVTFPDDYASTDLAGKDAVFTTTINYIWPELSDKFVKANLKDEGYSSVDDMKKKVEEKLRKSKEYTAVWTNLLDTAEFSQDPDELVELQQQIYVDSVTKMAYNYGLTLDQYLSYYGLDSTDALKEQYKASALQTAKQYVIAQAISDQEGITVGEDEVKEYFKDETEENINTYKTYFGDAYIRMQVRISNIVDKVMETAKIEETPETTAAAEETTAAAEETTAAAEETTAAAEETTAAAEETTAAAEETTAAK